MLCTHLRVSHQTATPKHVQGNEMLLSIANKKTLKVCFTKIIEEAWLQISLIVFGWVIT